MKWVLEEPLWPKRKRESPDVNEGWEHEGYELPTELWLRIARFLVADARFYGACEKRPLLGMRSLQRSARDAVKMLLSENVVRVSSITDHVPLNARAELCCFYEGCLWISLLLITSGDGSTDEANVRCLQLCLEKLGRGREHDPFLPRRYFVELLRQYSISGRSLASCLNANMHSGPITFNTTMFHVLLFEVTVRYRHTFVGRRFIFLPFIPAMCEAYEALETLVMGLGGERTTDYGSLVRLKKSHRDHEGELNTLEVEMFGDRLTGLFEIHRGEILKTSDTTWIEDYLKMSFGLMDVMAAGAIRPVEQAAEQRAELAREYFQTHCLDPHDNLVDAHGSLYRIFNSVFAHIPAKPLPRLCIKTEKTKNPRTKKLRE